jgi:hypothetical protein
MEFKTNPLSTQGNFLFLGNNIHNNSNEINNNKNTGDKSPASSKPNSGSSNISVYFKPREEMASHFLAVMTSARKQCAVTPNQRIFSRAFSRAAKLFTIGDFSACLRRLLDLQDGVMATAAPEHVLDAQRRVEQQQIESFRRSDMNASQANYNTNPNRVSGGVVVVSD